MKFLKILGSVWFICLIFSLFTFNYHWLEAGPEAKHYYQSIEVDIQVNQDSTFKVIEKQTYNLEGSFGFFYRDIELKDLDHISDIEVFDSQGVKLNENDYEVSYQDNHQHIQWDFPRRDFNNENKSWTIKYKVHGGLGFYEDYDELYWNAIFADRVVPVAYAQITVHLPARIEKEQIGQKLFIGQLGSKNENNNYEVIDNQTVRFWGYNIKAGEFLTILVTWPKGIVAKPFLERNQAINWLVLLVALALPVFVFVRMYRLWRKSGRDPKINKTIIAQYQPPEDLKPALVGILIDQRFDLKEVTATVVDLAVKGYLKIKEGKKGFFAAREYIFEKLKDGYDLKLFEEKIMKGIFAKGAVVSSNDLRNKFYRQLSEIKKTLHQEAAESDYLTGNIQKIRNKFRIPYIILFFLAGLGLFFGFSLSNSVGFIGLWLLIISIGLAVSGLIGLSFAYYMPSLAQKGVEAKWKWLGFKEYLQIAERFRLGAETIETFSKYLPYAIVFGVEKEWANRFADLKYQAPSWYLPAMVQADQASGIAPSFSNLASSISSFSSSISKTFGSSPSGSGAGAGGSAGGGGGGGGGGAG